MKTIFLDLEETIIKSIDNPILLLDQIAKIKTFINPDDTIVIFSFALWEESDLTKHISDLIFDLFGEFNIVFKNQLKPLFKKNFGIKDDLDFIDFSNSKQTCFILWIIDEISNNRINSDCLFFDDMISDLVLQISGRTVCLKNVKKLP